MVSCLLRNMHQPVPPEPPYITALLIYIAADGCRAGGWEQWSWFLGFAYSGTGPRRTILLKWFLASEP